MEDCNWSFVISDRLKFLEIMKQFVLLAAGLAAVSAVAFCPGEGRNGKNKRCVANE